MTLRDVNRLIFIRRLAILGLTLNEIKLCLGKLPASSNRKFRVEYTLKLLQMQEARAAKERATLNQLEKDIDDSVGQVTQCLDCQTESCPDHCPAYGQVL